MWERARSRSSTRPSDGGSDRNDSYYRGRPSIEQVKVVPYETHRAAWAALDAWRRRHGARGQSRVRRIHRGRITRLRCTPRSGPFYIPLVFNVQHPILDGSKSAARWRRRSTVTKSSPGHARPRDRSRKIRCGLLTGLTTGAARHYQYNPAAARVRLGRGRLCRFSPRLRVPEKWQAASRINCLFWSEDTQFERIALLLQRQLADGRRRSGAGGSHAEGAPGTSIVTGQFDTYLFQMTSGRSFDWIYRFWHSTAPGMPSNFRTPGIRERTSRWIACACPAAMTRSGPRSATCASVLRGCAGRISRVDPDHARRGLPIRRRRRIRTPTSSPTCGDGDLPTPRGRAR